LLVAIGVLAGACGPGGPVSVGKVRTVNTAKPSPSEPASGTPVPQETPSQQPRPTSSSTPTGSVSLQVWFQRGQTLFPERRVQPATRAVGSAALAALLAGPNADEIEGGVGTQIPAGSRLLGLDIDNGIATVDLSSQYASGGGSLSMTMRLAQVVYTITQFPTVKAVRFRLDGRDVNVFSGEGIVLDHPVTRGDYQDLLPAILVDEPVPGQEVGNPVTISGSADVFEATVSIRVFDANGRRIADTFTTATCGTGCRGTFSTQVRYRVDHRQPGQIMVFESSAEDGHPINVVRVPVTLTP
jgi:germination protein M